MRTLSLLPLVLLLPGCPDGKEDASMPTCSQTVTEVALDEVTPIGISGADVLARVPASESSTLVYADGTTSPLSLTFAPGATARFVDQEVVEPEGGTTLDIYVECDDYVAVDVDFGFATEDGVFAESFASEVTATAESLGGLTQELDLDAMSGTFDIDDFAGTNDYDEARARIEVAFAEDGTTSGVVSGDVSGEDECDEGDSCSAWDEMVAIGTWGPGDE